MNDRRKILLGLGTSTAVVAWHKPLVKAIALPAHAQASPMCPMVVIGNVLFGPVSGSNTPPLCTVTFDVLSASATLPLTIENITDNAPADTTIVYDTFGEVTDSVGSRVVWRGPATDAPFCSNLIVVNEVIFTVTASCAAAPNTPSFTQEFTLTEVLA